ncbi:hypothetical protein [Sorangium cellulosum]|uniref:Uncharacterized protein n=1 Tax=Sorangium cellulosum TaxID=56 RepID=A0A150QH05_SORCE|nr:hypothetical protein [Sorangium cellulosum]KYF67239.1 hypothetical protein BE15_11335 [Sorangium cellulosum]
MAMEYVMDPAAEQRLQAYLSEIGDVLGHPLRRESFATYALGLLGEAERKSVEPIAARACPDPERVEVAHHEASRSSPSTGIDHTFDAAGHASARP